MTHYRTQAYIGDGSMVSSMVLYHGRFFELASQAWHQATWAPDRVIEHRRAGEPWRVIISLSSGAQL